MIPKHNALITRSLAALAVAVISLTVLAFIALCNWPYPELMSYAVASEVHGCYNQQLLQFYGTTKLPEHSPLVGFSGPNGSGTYDQQTSDDQRETNLENSRNQCELVSGSNHWYQHANRFDRIVFDTRNAVRWRSFAIDGQAYSL